MMKIFDDNIERNKKNYKYLRDFVFDNIQKAIIEKRVKEGKRLTEDYISKSLNVSRTPVREAIYRLASSGMVRIIPHRGFIINRWSLKEIKDVLEVRAVLESLAVELAITSILPEEIEDLKRLLMKMEKSIENDDIKSSDILNTLFHEKIILASKNKEIYNVINLIKNKIHNFRIISLYTPKRIRQLSFKEHKIILEAILKKDKKLAKKLIENHIHRIKSIVEKRIKNSEKNR